MAKSPHEMAQEVTRELMEQGLIIEAGWRALELLWLLNPTPVEREELRCAFYAGAMHVFRSIMCGLDDGMDETDDDMEKMANMHRELSCFEREFRAKYPGQIP
jgi:hypothetical protein